MSLTFCSCFYTDTENTNIFSVLIQDNSLPASAGFLLCNYAPLFFQLQAADQIKKLYNLFLKIDATQVEVNPFGETPEGQGTKEKNKDFKKHIDQAEKQEFLDELTCMGVLYYTLVPT